MNLMNEQIEIEALMAGQHLHEQGGPVDGHERGLRMNHWDRLVEITRRDRGTVKHNVYHAMMTGETNAEWRAFCELLVDEPQHLRRLLEHNREEGAQKKK